MSSKKRARCFEFDENGKFKLLPMPMQIPAEFRGPSPQSKKRVTPMASEDFRSKNRKVEKLTVRKELFKAPMLSRQKSLIKTKSTKNAPKNLEDVIPLSALQSENTSRRNTTKHRGYQFGSPKTPSIDFTSQKPSFGAVKITVTPPTPGRKTTMMGTCSPSTKEFMEIEQACATPKVKKAKLLSPVTEVCSQLETTKISTTGLQECFDHIEAVLKDERQNFQTYQEQFHDYENKFRAYESRHRENERQLMIALSKLKQVSVDEGNKENRPRRSGRLADRKPNIPISPIVIPREADLRRSTLNNNLVKTLQKRTQTPRTQKANALYNSMRSDYSSILSTPSIVRSPNSSITTNKSISEKIQTQCLNLILHDTPLHK